MFIANTNSKQVCSSFYSRTNQEISTQLPSSDLNLQRTTSPQGWPEDTQILPVFEAVREKHCNPQLQKCY